MYNNDDLNLSDSTVEKKEKKTNRKKTVQELQIINNEKLKKIRKEIRKLKNIETKQKMKPVFDVLKTLENFSEEQLERLVKNIELFRDRENEKIN